MKLLLASPDRDLLRCYTQLLLDESRQVEPVFDGVQTMNALAAGDWDLLILSQELPRVRWQDLVQHCREEKIPVLVLLSAPLRMQHLIGEAVPWDYLSLPFLPGDLDAAVMRLTALQERREELRFAGFSVHPSSLRLEDLPITGAELAVLQDLTEARSVSGPEARIFVNAINAKLAHLKVPQRIGYQKEEGYRMVKSNE